MVEQLINFDTAKTAKEKGFKDHYGQLSYSSKGEISEWVYKYDHNGKPETLDAFTDHITAVTQSVLQKWLREKHNINVIPNKQNNNGQYFVYVWNKDKEPYALSDSMNSESYEEALEIGLQKALKLI